MSLAASQFFARKSPSRGVRLAPESAAVISRPVRTGARSMTSTPRLGYLTIAFLAALSFTACGETVTGPSVTPAAPAASLAIETNAVWHLRSITNAAGVVQAMNDPNLFTLTLSDDGKIAARVDCNRAAGGYTISGNTVSIGPLASIKAYCGDALFDSAFLTLLGGNTTAAASGSTLQLSSPRGTLPMRAETGASLPGRGLRPRPGPKCRRGTVIARRSRRSWGCTVCGLAAPRNAQSADPAPKALHLPTGYRSE
jgi:heat shock protein HslJ